MPTSSAAYRNERVVVIDAYCKGFPKAFGVTVLSPTRGRVKIFAEARAPITKVNEVSGYVVFSAESEGPNTVVTPPLSLDMTFDAVVAYNLARARSATSPGACASFRARGSRKVAPSSSTSVPSSRATAASSKTRRRAAQPGTARATDRPTNERETKSA